MSAVSESITVNVSAAEAFAQWSRFDQLPEFMSGVRRVDIGPDGMTHWTVDVGAVTREFDAKTLTAETDRRVSWTSVDGSPKHAGSVEFVPLNPSSTRVTAQLDIDTEGFVENAADKLGIVNVELKRDLENFKDFMEDPAEPRGARRRGSAV